MISINQLTFNHFGVNSYLLYNEESRQCAIVDPGMEASYEDAQLFQLVNSKGLTPTLILLTHAHVDHICGLHQTADRYKLPVTMHRDGAKLLRQAEAYGGIMGFYNIPDFSDLTFNYVDDGTLLPLGDDTIECRHTPGHCVGSLCFVLHNEKSIITGDTLFQGSIGRTDLPGGNYRTLIDSIHSRLLPLPDDYKVLPGHGPSSTLGDERAYNPFIN